MLLLHQKECIIKYSVVCLKKATTIWGSAITKCLKLRLAAVHHRIKRGQVQWDMAKNKNMTNAKFLKTDQGKETADATGGIQGRKGTLFGKLNSSRHSVNNFDQIQRCMLKKSYHYMGKCENQIMKATPGCDAS